MKSELVVDVKSSEITTAFIEDGRLAEINREPRDMNWSVGNIYYGKIKKIMPALNAAFVDIGHEKDAFLHYLDLGAQFNNLYGYTQQVVADKKRITPFPKSFNEPIVGKLGTIEDILQVGQEILVQITKEPINTKGPRLTAEISIAGRYLVLIPFQDKVMVSGKIKGETEKKRLRNLVASIKPKGYGVIIRTVAANIELEELQREMNILYKRWEDTIIKLQKAEAPMLLSAEIGRTIGIIRDVFNSSFDHIYVNDSEMYSEIVDYVELIAPDRKQVVKKYDGEQPILDYFDITRQSKIGLGRTVSFKNGGYLVMEKTEALFVIDVNSGTRKVGEDQEENALNVNLAAADEIAHQLRLRDIGGIIVIDFIDMSNADHRQQLHDYMKKLMVSDRAKHNVLPLSKFGLMQITRQRVRPAVEIDIQEVCPTCLGKGKIQSSILFADQLENIIIQTVAKYGKKMKLYVHPYVYAYISKGWIFSRKCHWKRRYGIKVIEDQSLGFLEYYFIDLDGNRVEVEQPVSTPKKLVFDDEKPVQKVEPKPMQKQETKPVQKQEAKSVKREQPKVEDKVVTSSDSAPTQVKAQVKQAKTDVSTDTAEKPVAEKQSKSKAKSKAKKSAEQSADKKEEPVINQTKPEEKIEPKQETTKKTRKTASKKVEKEEEVKSSADVVEEVNKPKRSRRKTKVETTQSTAEPTDSLTPNVEQSVATPAKPKRSVRKKSTSKKKSTDTEISNDTKSQNNAE